jgi:proteasome lid subunit RPN8/RPN11
MEDGSMPLTGQKNPWLIDKRVWYRIQAHVLTAFPDEACGILLSPRDGPREVIEVFRAKNISKERKRDRYTISPHDFLMATEKAEREGLEISGFYHSHPGYPALPSSYDWKMAWTGYIYLILEVKKERVIDARAWSMEEENGHFAERGIIIKTGRKNPIISGGNR